MKIGDKLKYIQDKFTKDGPVNQLIVDPVTAWLFGKGFAELLRGVEPKEWQDYYPEVLALVQIGSATLYYFLSKGEQENRVSKLFRDYFLPPLLAGVIGYLIGKKYGNEWLGYATAILMLIRELIVDVVGYRISERLGYQ
ncbi:MAG: hypothetical protein KQA31_02170 [Candidatus Aenigmarchaeota archaeon]|nr:hypothetical protein [Candidatus Aenigmarchaeota archaeon]